MKIRGFAGWSVVLPALFFAAVAAVVLPQTPARAENLVITGAQLKLVQGSPEDMMRFPESSYPEASYTVPKPGDIVRVLDEADLYDYPHYWPEVMIVWEDCGQKADFDFQDQRGYLNGRVFAVILSSPAIWEWLGKATEAEVAGVRYIEVQGIPPADFAPMLAKLPKRRIVVRCAEGCFASLPGALAPLDPLGLTVKSAQDESSLDFAMFTSCAFLSVQLSCTSVVRLPPTLKYLRLGGERGSLTKLRGAESTLEAITVGRVTMFTNWMTEYKSLRDVALTEEFLGDNYYRDFIQAIVQLPELRALRLIPGTRDLSFLSLLKKLRSLWLKSVELDFVSVSALAELEFLWIEQQCDCDFSALSALKRVKYFGLLINRDERLENGEPQAFDPSVLEPIAGMISLLGFRGWVMILHPESMPVLASLESLSFSPYVQQVMPVSCLAELANLKSVVGLLVTNPDISALGKLHRLERLSLSSYQTLDLSGLKGCVALRELSVGTRGELDLEPLAALESLTRLLVFCSGDGEGEKVGVVPDQSSLSKLKRLRFLTLRVSGLQSLDFLGSPECLRALSIYEFAGTDMRAIGRLNSLRSLNIYRCDNIEAGSSIALPISLRTLCITGCNKLADLSFLEGAASLKDVTISQCPKFAALPKLAAPLKSLVRIYLDACEGLKDTAGLASMPAIEWLGIREYMGTEIAGVDTLTCLRELVLSYPKELLHVPKASPKAPLLLVVMTGSRKLQSIEGIETWKEVRRLEISLGEQQADLTLLTSLTKLEFLTLADGKPETDISPLMKMTWLKFLSISYCMFCNPKNTDLLKKALPGCQVYGRD